VCILAEWYAGWQAVEWYAPPAIPAAAAFVRPPPRRPSASNHCQEYFLNCCFVCACSVCSASVVCGGGASRSRYRLIRTVHRQLIERLSLRLLLTPLPTCVLLGFPVDQCRCACGPSCSQPVSSASTSAPASCTATICNASACDKNTCSIPVVHRAHGRSMAVPDNSPNDSLPGVRLAIFRVGCSGVAGVDGGCCAL